MALEAKVNKATEQWLVLHEGAEENSFWKVFTRLNDRKDDKYSL